MKDKIKNIFSGKYIFLFFSLLFFVLAFISGNIYFNRSTVTKEVKLLEKNLHHLQNEFEHFLQDTSIIYRLIQNKETLFEFEALTKNKGLGLYLYTADVFGIAHLKFWNQQIIIPPPEIHGFADGEYFMSLSNGRYLAIKKTLAANNGQNNIVACALILIQSEFYIETTYLPEEFLHNSTAGKRIFISDDLTPFPIKSMNGKTICYVDKKSVAGIPYNDPKGNFFKFFGILFLLVFIFLISESKPKSNAGWKNIVFLILILSGLRLLTYLFPSLLNLRQFELFDPTVYGTSHVHRSLGDLLINSTLLFWVVLFTWNRVRTKDEITSGFNKKSKWIAGMLSIVILLYCTFSLAGLVKSLIADSKISFDVTDFFSLDRFTVFGFIILALLSITYYYFSQLLFRFINLLFDKKKLLIYFTIALPGLIYLTFGTGSRQVLFLLPVLGWLLFYTFLILNQDFLFKRFRINIANVIFWIFIFSLSISAIMLSEIKEAELEKRKIIADKLVENSDPSSERLLRIALDYLDKGFLSNNFNRFYDKASNKKFRDSIVTENYRGYLNKYETKLFVFDHQGKPINNNDPVTLNELNTILNVQSKSTSIPEIYYYETSFDKFTYITRREVLAEEDSLLGYLFIISNPKKYISNTLFPELFRQLKQADPEYSPVYSYAVYNNNSLVSPTSRYPFAVSLKANDIPKEEYELRKNEDYDELWFRASGSKVVVIARKRNSLIETITLFSYVFCSFLFLVALAQLISGIIGIIYHKRNFKKLFQLNIRNQVHNTIIFISILSFLIIGFATISFFINRYNRNNKDKLSRTMQIMVNEMRKKISDQRVFDDEIKVYDPVSGSGLQKLVEDVADVHDVDVNVYDLDGNLKVSSEEIVYEKGVVSKKMDPVAFYHLNRLRKVQYVQKEKIASLEYLSIYAPVRDEDGRVEAYLNIPFFASQRELNFEISNFLVTIINLNAFIFLIAGLIALFITNRITRSFSLISDKMKEVSLGSMNEAIEWNRGDEIGELVKEYNKMVAKLEESAASLAKSEREGAWREMARQVAHEIKNPLTPMKLSIQHLQRSIDNNQPNIKELTGSVANTLVEQIDHLSKIASDFSQFANIGNVSVEKFDLHDVINSLTELYRSNPRIELIWNPIPDKIMLLADRTQMNRLFTNLLANAEEACNSNSICRIEINESYYNDSIRISVKDNGDGIPAEMQSRIFEPNFTTKTSGTGLGLAMCKGIVEQAKGKIWFDTTVGKGTTFHVGLPVFKDSI